jgi:hypothetical protein
MRFDRYRLEPGIHPALQFAAVESAMPERIRDPLLFQVLESIE